MKIRRALLSASDKSGIVEFARGLAEMEVELISTGGTASTLRGAGLTVRDVSEVTGFPEMMDGRVKTLHPRIHGALLGLRDNEEHRAAMAKHGMEPIDLVCVNLYPFEQTVARGVTREEAIEQIDIGGPSMIRSASKNFRSVIVVTSPRQYADVLDGLRKNSGWLPEEKLLDLARAAFRTTARYDAAIANYLAGEQTSLFPSFYAPFFEKVRDLRYGENPFQTAALYAERGAGGPSVASGEILWGKELSYNNLIDLDQALRIVREFQEPACVVIKHTNPCGCAVGASVAEAWTKAHAGDPLSAFGGVLGFNTVVDAATADLIATPDHFIECIVAPGFEPAAINTLTQKPKWGKSLRLVKVGEVHTPLGPRDRNIRRILGGLLLQEYDQRDVPEGGSKVVSARQPTDAERRDLDFAWLVAKHVTSNAIVLAKDGMVVGVGAGQMSRVDSSEIAVRKAGDRAKGSVLASDAFFPFADGLEVALRAGVTAAVEPGGSRNDHDVVTAANAAGAALLFTGMRHFRH
ncbi:MAG: bifunctional phosphoribosylaminoimidazolecarboxamide formyltransferase/IMP cyclohydrolase [Planctomycetes bacterium]|nr:bifunctional phosphoribosylaminoimidazolecarboxamide formyltransferase/IMP cyclohydrolase [Planctomycetota bacterium]